MKARDQTKTRSPVSLIPTELFVVTQFVRGMKQHLYFCVQEINYLSIHNFSFCLNQMKPKLKAIQPKEIHFEVVFKLKSCKRNNQMYKTLQKA